jgi:hypothetical protein
MGKDFETDSFKECFKDQEHTERIKKMKEKLKD